MSQSRHPDAEIEDLTAKKARRDLPERLTQRDCDRGLWQILFPDVQENQP
jgi:hypothetical protein